MINIYSNTNQTALKYLKDTEANICNILVMTGDFNIRDSSWDPLFPFHLSHNNLLSDVADSLNFLLSNPTIQVPTRYLDNTNDVNSVIDLMFLRPNFSEIDNYTIHSF